MTKIIKTLFCLLILCTTMYAQDIQRVQKVEMIDGVLYLFDNENQFKVITNKVLVKPKGSIRDIEYRYKILYEHKLGFVDIEVPEGINVTDFVDKLRKSGKYESVDYITESKLTAFVCSVQDIENHGWHLSRVNAEKAWAITMGSPSVKVGIIDTGIDRGHYDIGFGNDGYSNVSYTLGYDYKNDISYQTPLNDHGTNVAGVLGAKTNNNYGIAGIAGGNGTAGVTMISYCVMNQHVEESEGIGDAIIDAVNNGAKIINISIKSSYDPYKDQAIGYAYNNGATIVCSTGNDNSGSISYPASDYRTIAVGAINQDDYRWVEPGSSEGSNYGSGLDIVAPGDMIYTTKLSNTYWYYAGTSLASPLVAGTVALMRSVNSSLTPGQITKILRNTASKIPYYTSFGWNSEVGYGVLNAFAAVLGACNTSFLEDTSICYGSTASFSLNNLPSGLTVQWSLTDGYGPTTPTIQTSGNSCSITNNLSMTFSGKLNAKVYDGTNLIATLTKNLVLYSDFYGQYTSDNLSGTIDYTHIFYVKPGYNTTITSLNLVGATASYSNSGTTPSYFSLDPTLWKLYFTMPTNNNGIPVIINVTDLCGNQFQLYAIPQSSYYLNISYEGSNINISLNENGNALRNPSIEQPWSYEIRSATRGDIKASGNVYSSSTTISTAGWPKGIYIVKATIGKEETTEKIIVR